MDALPAAPDRRVKRSPPVYVLEGSCSAWVRIYPATGERSGGTLVRVSWLGRVERITEIHKAPPAWIARELGGLDGVSMPVRPPRPEEFAARRATRGEWSSKAR